MAAKMGSDLAQMCHEGRMMGRARSARRLRRGPELGLGAEVRGRRRGRRGERGWRRQAERRCRGRRWSMVVMGKVRFGGNFYLTSNATLKEILMGGRDQMRS